MCTILVSRFVKGKWLFSMDILIFIRVIRVFRGGVNRSVPMHCLGGKRGEADGDVFRSLGSRRAVPDPFAGAGDDGLSGGNVEGTGF